MEDMPVRPRQFHRGQILTVDDLGAGPPTSTPAPKPSDEYMRGFEAGVRSVQEPKPIGGISGWD